MLLLAFWRENNGPVMQINELIAVSGFVVGPLMVKSFLSADNFSNHHRTEFVCRFLQREF